MKTIFVIGTVRETGGGPALQPYADYLPLSKALTPVLSEKGIYIGTVQVTGAIHEIVY